MKRSHITFLLLPILWLTLLLATGVPTNAAPSLQGDPDCDTLLQAGATLYYQAQYPEALQQLQAALICFQEAGDRAGEGTTLTVIGAVYYARGRYVEALEMHQQSLVIRREVGDRAGEGTTLNNIGKVYRTQGRYVEALEVYQQALAIHREVGNRVGEGTILNNIGAVYYTQGRYAEALESFQQALAIYREVGNRPDEGTTLHCIGFAYEAQERYAEALESYQQALAVSREVGDRAGEGITLSNIGGVYRLQERYAEALDAYQQAMDIFEAVRAAAGSEQSRASFIAQYAGLYARAVGLFHQQGQDEDAFFTSERGRARAFLDSLSTGYVELTDDETAALLAQEQAAYAQRQAVQDALAKARAPSAGSGQAPPGSEQAPSDPALVADLEAQLAQAEATYAEALAAIEARGDQLAALVPSRKTVLDLAEVQALLDEHTTLLSYFVLEDQTLVFLITPDSFQVVEIEVSGQELTNRVSYFREVIGFQEPEATQRAAQELYQVLIAPLAASLHTPWLAIVPHGPLHYLPFAALLDPETDRYLLQDYSLVTLPSASALPFITTAEEQEVGESVLVLGNPATGDLDATASLAVERGGLGSLPFAEQEAGAIAALYGVEPLIGEAATEGAVRSRATGAELLHLAAHGHFNPVAPLSSLIALAPDGAYDGWLTVGEVYGLDLSQADLVVLSACQTQLGELSAGDELVGLTRAFIFAGTPTVVASLWSVDDEATAVLMERFHTHLSQGMGKAEALRQAQLEVMGDYAHPYYWSGFVMSGDGGAIGETPPQVTASVEAEGAGEAEVGETPAPSVEEPPSRPSSWLWLVAGAGLLIFVVIGGVLWRWARRRPTAER